MLVRLQCVVCEVYGFVQLYLVFDVVWLYVVVIVVMNVDDLFMVCCLVWVVGQDGCIFEWDVDLVIEVVCDLGVDFFWCVFVGVYVQVEGMMDVIVCLFCVQLCFEVFGSLGNRMCYSEIFMLL